MQRKCIHCGKVKTISIDTDNSAPSKSYCVHCNCTGDREHPNDPGLGTVTSRGLPIINGGWAEDEML